MTIADADTMTPMTGQALWKRLLSALLTLYAVGLLLSTSAWAIGWRLNIMPSVPVGLYRMRAIHEPIRYGALVLVSTEASRRLMAARHGWLAAFWPILKPVAALAGDIVCHGSTGIVVHRQRSLDTLSYGPALLPQTSPAMGTCLRVPAGMVYVASDQSGSLDSRYFGWVAETDLRGYAEAIWTW